jgi:hypothetical protein
VTLDLPGPVESALHFFKRTFYRRYLIVPMDLWVVKDASRRSKMENFWGRCILGAPSRQLPCAWLPSTPGARILGVSALRASAGQRKPVRSGRGTGWEGGRELDQAIWNRSNDRAGDRGGARAGKPRWVSNRVRCQAILGFQGRLDLSMAFMLIHVESVVHITRVSRYRPASFSPALRRTRRRDPPPPCSSWRASPPAG